ncbi:MAG TPA: hydantoinase/oxoprolinase family protein [Candidatus Binataceae bacterium]|nr:hydantoinase/oxoprolinase family protein [Candidatus Binataceae bacterium]
MTQRIVHRRSKLAPAAIVGVDTGGTFTDLVAIVDGEIRVHKVLSTPSDPSAAVIRGISELLAGTPPELITYSSTVATNALLEKKGARVALFTNAGFEDLIEIGRQNRNDLYALVPSRPEPLIARAMRFGVKERTLFDGAILRRLNRAELARIRRLAARCGAESFAVCLLHSYANPAGENAIVRALAQLGRPVSVSHRLVAEYREYERFSTTAINAYVAPKMASHLKTLGRRLGQARLRVMQSDGGAIGVTLARSQPARTILSGPAAGVIGASALARFFGVERFITFDMGGTSTDVALFDGGAQIRSLSHPENYAVSTPTIDIHTVGAGGGSIARLDSGGAIQVGPESAGADPGPACYGRGDVPTVTDADLLAGRLVAERFLGGQMKLWPGRAAQAIGGIARLMGISAMAASSGVIRVVNAGMERAIRSITVERGFDPREFALVAFGGAGPMHAAELALELGMRRVVMPRNPGLLCAWGAAGAAATREYSLTVREANPDYWRLVRRAAGLIRRGRLELTAEGYRKIQCELRTDLRYLGQSYELNVPLTPRFAADFHALHRRTFGHSAADSPIEAVNIRVRASAGESAPAPRRMAKRTSRPTPLFRRPTLCGRRKRTVAVYDREDLGAGVRLAGPIVVTELSATTYVPPEFTMRTDDFGNLHLEAD